MDNINISNREILHSLVSYNLSRKKLYKLIEEVDDLTRLTSGEDRVQLFKKFFDEETSQKLIDGITDQKVQAYEKTTSELGYHYTTIYDQDYPKNLAEIDDFPLLLYYEGDITLASEDKILGVVGTRKPTRYGREMAGLFSKGMAENGVITISGLAYGIDSEVARATLDAGGRTIAVLGGGFKNIYPATNASLAEEIVNKGGLILSEYKPTDRPTQYTFPERNRIISGVSSGVLIVEAGEKSGSLITANFALEQGRELFVLPANINSIQSAGSNRLLYEMPQSLVLAPKNILESFGLASNDQQNSKDKNIQLTIEQKLVYDLLVVEETHFDEIVSKTKIPPNKLVGLLSEMEIAGVIKQLSGNYYGV